jgi:hypothetical protein
MSHESVAAFRALAETFIGRASPETNRSVGAPLDERIAQSLDLLDHGERVVAFENLGQNLYEYEIPISADEYEQLATVGREWNVAPDGWRFLAELIRA